MKRGADCEAPLALDVQRMVRNARQLWEHLVRDEVREALAIDRSSSVEQRTIDITTTGRTSGKPRRIEIWFYRLEGSIYLSGMPGPRTRDWLANLMAGSHLTFHLKHGVLADLPAVATVITDPHERRPY